MKRPSVDKKQQGEEEDDMKKRTKEKEVKQAIEHEASGASGQETGLCASEQKKYDLAEKSLRSFIEAAWPVVEPGRQFAGNWHIDSICSHLEAVTRGEIQSSGDQCSLPDLKVNHRFGHVAGVGLAAGSDQALSDRIAQGRSVCPRLPEVKEDYQQRMV